MAYEIKITGDTIHDLVQCATELANSLGGQVAPFDGGMPNFMPIPEEMHEQMEQITNRIEEEQQASIISPEILQAPAPAPVEETAGVKVLITHEQLAQEQGLIYFDEKKKASDYSLEELKRMYVEHLNVGKKSSITKQVAKYEAEAGATNPPAPQAQPAQQPTNDPFAQPTAQQVAAILTSQPTGTPTNDPFAQPTAQQAPVQQAPVQQTPTEAPSQYAMDAQPIPTEVTAENRTDFYRQVVEENRIVECQNHIRAVKNDPSATLHSLTDEEFVQFRAWYGGQV